VIPRVRFVNLESNVSQIIIVREVHFYISLKVFLIFRQILVS